MRIVAGVAPGWHPDPYGRWQVRWWDGATWTDHVASGGRRGHDPAPAGDATADLVNLVVAAALGFVDLAESMPGSVDDTSVTTALWRHAESRRDILLLAHGHLAALEQKGSQSSRARALTYLSRTLDSPPPMPR